MKTVLFWILGVAVAAILVWILVVEFSQQEDNSATRMHPSNFEKPPITYVSEKKEVKQEKTYYISSEKNKDNDTI